MQNIFVFDLSKNKLIVPRAVYSLWEKTFSLQLLPNFLEKRYLNILHIKHHSRAIVDYPNKLLNVYKYQNIYYEITSTLAFSKWRFLYVEKMWNSLHILRYNVSQRNYYNVIVGVEKIGLYNKWKDFIFLNPTTRLNSILNFLFLER